MIKDEIRDLPNGEVFVDGLNEVVLSSKSQASSMLNWALQQRVVRSTHSNVCSSRSHCVFNLVLIQRERGESQIKMTKLRVVDLAGSEKFVRSYRESKIEEKKRINELISINKSLTALGHCIKSLEDKNTHVP